MPGIHPWVHLASPAVMLATMLPTAENRPYRARPWCCRTAHCRHVTYRHSLLPTSQLPTSQC